MGRTHAYTNGIPLTQGLIRVTIRGGFNVTQVNDHEELEIEKVKLIRLVDEALKNGTPLAQDEAVIEQNRKVDALVVKIQKENEKQRKNQQER